jgi:hypothetical protein
MSTCLALLCASPHGQTMAARHALHRDGLPGLFFSFRGFTRPCCCGGSRGCWIGLVIDWIKFASTTSRTVWPPSSGKGGEVCPCPTMPMQGSALEAAPKPRRGRADSQRGRLVYTQPGRKRHLLNLNPVVLCADKPSAQWSYLPPMNGLMSLGLQIKFN